MTVEASFTIGRLAKASGCKVQTIRYYEGIGLMPQPARSPGNQRLYGPAHVNRLSFIRHCRELGFPLGEIRELLSLADDPDRPCEAVDGIARTHIEGMEKRISALSALKDELERIVRQCAGGKISQCRILEALSDQSLRLSGDSS
ncbi:MAG: helix-turn-helix domain-containing protein [Alphaproteobacteria bacterium]|nr:helix-turn-helix domain-containing protein [Alphaproteobacteria bacterium]